MRLSVVVCAPVHSVRLFPSVCSSSPSASTYLTRFPISCISVNFLSVLMSSSALSARGPSRCFCSTGSPLQWLAGSPSSSSSLHSSSPSSAPYPIASLLSAGIDLCSQAGLIIRSIYEGGDLKAIDKSTPGSAPSTTVDNADKEKMDKLGDPQTLADTEAQKLLVGSLSKLFPSLTIIGEEGEQHFDSTFTPYPAKLDLLNSIEFPHEYATIPIEDLVLWIDPLDGTKEYTVGNTDGVTILLGISSKKTERAVAGIIYQPFRGRTVWGALGLGVFGAQADLRLIQQRKAANQLSVATTRSHATPLLAEALKWIGADEVLKLGGAGAKGFLVLDGVTDAYFFPTPGTNRWDIVAVDACLHAAGGCLTDSYGEPIRYTPIQLEKSDPKSLAAAYSNKDGLIGTRDRALHSRLVLNKEKVEEFLKANPPLPRPAKI